MLLIIKEKGWGFGRLKLECPICRGKISKEDWYPWVRDEVVNVYLQAKQLKNQFGIYCKSCGHRQLYKTKPADSKEYSVETPKNAQLEDIIRWQTKISDEYKKEFIDGKTKSLVFKYIAGQEEEHRYECESSFSEESEYSENSQPPRTTESIEASDGVKKLLNLDLKYLCDECGGEICMKCGESSWHLNQRKCLKYLEEVVAKTDKNIQWKLQNW